MCRIFEYYVIFIYFQAAVSALLSVSVLYVEKNQNKYYIIFENLTIRHIPNSFSYEKPGTLGKIELINKNLYFLKVLLHQTPQTILFCLAYVLTSSWHQTTKQRIPNLPNCFTNIYYNFFFNWQTENKILFWTNKKFVFFLHCSK